MQRDPDGPDDAAADDAAWRAIVDNYGERPELDEPGSAGGTAPAGEPDPVTDDVSDHVAEGDPMWFSAPLVDPADRYVPPPPPPLPRPSRDRFVAWAGVFGSPAVLLVCLVAGISLPPLLAYALVAAFVGGFVYLVWQMPRGPRDPWDDGAQV